MAVIMDKNVFVVIMAGGRGERFWPKSRIDTPKQLLPIVSDKTMLEETVNRIKSIVPVANILIVANQSQVTAIKSVLPEFIDENIIGEPCGRNTAPCIALAAAYCSAQNPHAVMVVLPADHVIHQTTSFTRTLNDVISYAIREDALFTIGIEPRFPSTGYGYIHCGEQRISQTETEFFTVKAFKEKPTNDIAESFLKSGDYLWNSGMFVWKTEVFVRDLQHYLPDMYDIYHQFVNAFRSRNLEEIQKCIGECYPSMQNISIDYGIMEKASKVICAKSAFDWDDVGAWDSVAKHFTNDERGNVLKGNCIAHEIDNCLLVSDKKILAGVGIKDLIVVVTDDAVLVCNKNNAQDVKRIVQILSDNPNFKRYL